MLLRTTEHLNLPEPSCPGVSPCDAVPHRLPACAGNLVSDNLQFDLSISVMRCISIQLSKKRIRHWNQNQKDSIVHWWKKSIFYLRKTWIQMIKVFVHLENICLCDHHVGLIMARPLRHLFLLTTAQEKLRKHGSWTHSIFKKNKQHQYILVYILKYSLSLPQQKASLLWLFPGIIHWPLSKHVHKPHPS